MRRALRDHGLSLFFGAIFLLALAAQAVVGRAQFNAEQEADGFAALSLARYVTSSDFAVDVMENWQSEYLQFMLYVFATVWLLQRGSPESKEPDRLGEESDADQLVGPHAKPESPSWARAGGLRTAVYSRSLGLAMAAVFLASWAAQSVTGRSAYNEQRLTQLQAPLSWPSYVGSAQFWSRTLQNWQSEFLAVGSMAVFAIFLRQRGSPESKPVGAPHGATGVEG
jgi:hypothetical protein